MAQSLRKIWSGWFDFNSFWPEKPELGYANNSHRQYLTGQLIAEYKGVFGKHDINVLGGWSAEENLYEDLQGKRTNIVGNELPALNLGDTDGWSNAADENEWALLSGFMRASYAFAAKYLVEVNFRADASSRFSKKNRWGVFPSASVGWRITEEKFMQNQHIFDNLKLRASWGQLGTRMDWGYTTTLPAITSMDIILLSRNWDNGRLSRNCLQSPEPGKL